MTWLRRLTRHRMPDAVVDLLEVGAACVPRGEIARILHDGGHYHPLVAIGFAGDVEILGDARLFAVRHAVLLQVPRPEARRHHGQLPAPARTGAPPAAGDLPLRARDALPRAFRRR